MLKQANTAIVYLSKVGHSEKVAFAILEGFETAVLFGRRLMQYLQNFK